MKVKKNLIEKVAKGETVLKGEAVEIAKELLKKVLLLNSRNLHSSIKVTKRKYMMFRIA